MTIGERKDAILRHLDKNKVDDIDYRELRSLFSESEALTEHNILGLCHDLSKEHALKFEGISIRWIPNTSEILRNGGYAAREIEKLKKQEDDLKKQKNEVIQSENVLLDNRLKKWQIFVFWTITACTIIGAIIGLITFFRKK